MAVGITASLIGVYYPRTVQVAVTGLTVGVTYQVTGEWAGGSWSVRAGEAVAAATQVVLSDLAAPINVPVTYKVAQGTSQATTAPLTVDYSHDSVLQSLSGDTSVPFELLDNGGPRRIVTRQTLFTIPGRRRPVVRYDVTAGESGQWVVDTDGTDTQTLGSLLGEGGPLLVRSNGAVADMEPSAFVLFTDVSSALQIDTLRRWELAYQVIDDPEPNTLIGLPTWENFDAVYAASTWTAFDAEWAGRTWENFDLEDWATRAAP